MILLFFGTGIWFTNDFLSYFYYMQDWGPSMTFLFQYLFVTLFVASYVYFTLFMYVLLRCSNGRLMLYRDTEAGKEQIVAKHWNRFKVGVPAMFSLGLFMFFMVISAQWAPYVVRNVFDWVLGVVISLQVFVNVWVSRMVFSEDRYKCMRSTMKKVAVYNLVIFLFALIIIFDGITIRIQTAYADPVYWTVTSNVVNCANL